MSNTSYKQIILRQTGISVTIMSPVWQESQQYTNWLHGRLKKMVR